MDVVPYAAEFDLNVDSSLWVEYRDVLCTDDVRAGTRHRAGQCESGGHPDRAGRGMRRMAATGREVARRQARRTVAITDQHGFGHDAGGHIAQAHQMTSGDAQHFQALQQRLVRVQFDRRFASAHPEVTGAHDHQGHGRVDAGEFGAVDDIDAASGRKHRPGHCAPGIQEVQPDGRSRAGHAVDAGIAEVGDTSAGRLHRHIDARPGVDVEHPRGRRALGGGDQALFDRERHDAGEHVAAVRPCVHRTLADADLREQVVDVAAGFGRARHDGHLAVQRAAAAHAVELQQVRRTDGADQRLVTAHLVLRQPLAQEERAARGAGAHQDTGNGSVHGINDRRRRPRCELHVWDRLIQNGHQ